MAGTFPPAEPLVLWLGEQVQIHLFGGSPTAVTFQFWVNVASSLIQVLGQPFRFLDPLILGFFKKARIIHRKARRGKKWVLATWVPTATSLPCDWLIQNLFPGSGTP